MGKTPRPVRGVAHALPEGCAVGGAAACPPRRHHRRGCADLGRAHRIPPPPSTNPTRRAGAPATGSRPGKGRERCGKGKARSHGEGQREQPATIRRGDGGDHPPPIRRAGSPLPASREMNTKRRDSRDLKKIKKKIKRLPQPTAHPVCRGGASTNRNARWTDTKSICFLVIKRMCVV